MSFKNIRRNEFRARKKSGRARTNAVSSMTPQGQALWASRNIDNAFGFIGPEHKFIPMTGIDSVEGVEGFVEKVKSNSYLKGYIR